MTAYGTQTHSDLTMKINKGLLECKQHKRTSIGPNDWQKINLLVAREAMASANPLTLPEHIVSL